MRSWFPWFRRPSRTLRRQSRPAWRRPTYRPNLDVLEDRRLLAAPVIDPIQVPLNVPAGKTLIVPVTASDPGGGTVSISMAPASGTSGITVTPINDTTFLQISVSHTSSGSAGDTSFSGTMEFELFGDMTPRTVAYIEGLVESGFYNGLIFHRVVPNFVIQGGDPTGTGSGGPPGASATQSQIQQLQFPDEFNTNAIFSGTGQLAMANSGNDTNGSQFFVTDGTQRSLDFNHTIFGQLVRGFDILNDIESVPTDSKSKPLSPVTMTNVEIVQDPNAQVFLVKNTGTATGSVSLTVTATPSTAGETATTETETGQVIADTTNDPPILSVSQAPLNFGQAPSSNPVTNLVTAENTPVNITLSSTDLEGNTPTYSVTVTDSTANATVTQSATTPGQFTITPNTGFTGLIHLQASVTESGATRNNGPDSQVFTLAVGDQALAATAAAGFSTAEGASATQTLAPFTDADLTALPSDFQVSINWGDGTTLDTTSGTVSGSNGQFTVKGTHTYTQAGQYAPLVTITDVHAGAAGADNGGAAAQATTTATVSDAALTAQGASGVTATAGTLLSGALVATFTDANPDATAGNYTATIDWGDGTTPLAGTVQAASGGGFEVLGSHTYAAAGTFNVKVTIDDVNLAGPLDPSPATATATDTATVAAAATVTLAAGQPVTVTGTAGTALTAVQVATFTDTATGAQASNYTATINWNDGTPLDTTATVQALTGGGFQVLGSHTYASSGTFTPAVTITSTNAASTPSTISVDATATLSAGTLAPPPTATPTDQSYVNQLFLDLTGQAPTAQQLSDFSSQRTGGTSRLSVVNQVQALAQTKTHQVQQVYQSMFGTGPTAQQLSSGVKVLGKNDDVGKLRVQLLSSDAFFTSLGGGTATGYLSALGQELLHGSIDAATQATLSQELTSGASRLTVLQGLVKTDLQQVEQVGVQNVYQQYMDRAPTAAETSAGTSMIGQGKEDQLIASLVSSDEYFNKTQPAGSTTVTSSAGSSSFGQSVTFTATVAATGVSGTPTGTVTFEDSTSGTTLGTASLDATGTATFSTAGLSVGTHSITAVYGGDGSFPPSSGTVTQTVSAAATTTTVTSSAGTSSAGQSVTFTATITASAPGSGTPTGTVTFTDTTSGTTLGTVTLNTSGTATFSTTGLGVGTHTITASYGGTGNFTASSGTVSQTVTT